MEFDQLKDFTYRFEKDLSAVSVAMPDTKLDAQSLDQLIYSLGKLRATLKPAHPQSPPSIQEWLYHPLDVWHIPQNTGPNPPVETGFLLLVRSPSLGWFQYEATPDEARALLAFLQQQAIERPPDSELN